MMTSDFVDAARTVLVMFSSNTKLQRPPLHLKYYTESIETFPHSNSFEKYNTLQTNFIMDQMPVSNKTVGEPESVTNKTLETGAGAVQVRCRSS